MLNATQYRTPIRGEIRLKNKQQFFDAWREYFKDISDGRSYFMMFEYKNVRFRIYYNSRFSHINFFAYTSFGWSVSDSIYDYANKEYIEDLGKFLSEKFHCPVSLEWFSRSSKGRMRFNDGQIWSGTEKMPSSVFPKAEDGFIYKLPYFDHYKDQIYYEFEKKNEDSNKENELQAA